MSILKFVLTFCVFLLLAFTIVYLRELEPGAVEISDNSLGTNLPADSLIRSSVELINTGDEAVTVEGVRGCCGISVVDSFPVSIAAKSNRRIGIEYRTPLSSGNIERKITILYNGDARLFHLLGSVKSEVDLSGSSVDLGFVRPGHVAARSFSVRVPGKSAEALSVVVSSDRIAVNREDCDDADRSVFSIVVRENARPGNLHEFVYVRTNCETNKNAIVEVTGQVISGVIARPQIVFFGEVNGDTPVEKKISLYFSSNEWKNCELLVRDEDSSYLSASIEHVSDDENKAFLKVAILPKKTPRKLKTDIVFVGPDEITVSVPVLAAGANANVSSTSGE